MRSADFSISSGRTKECGRDCEKVALREMMMETGERPWGSYTVLDESGGYKIKRIVVNPGARLSLQMHHHRSEHWIVVSGAARVTCGSEEFIVNVNESTFIPIGMNHRLENPGVIPLTIIEVQSGEYLGEDDIVRFKDDYDRVTEKGAKPEEFVTE